VRRLLAVLATAVAGAACAHVALLDDPDPTSCKGVTCAGMCCPQTYVCGTSGKCEAGGMAPIGWDDGARAARDAGRDAR
jgi:hypothetical protein